MRTINTKRRLRIALHLIAMMGVGLTGTAALAQETKPVTGFIRAPGTYDLGKGSELEIASTDADGLDIQLMWGPNHGAGIKRRSAVKPGSWFVFVESREIVWLAYDGGNDLRVIMTDESGHGGLGGVSAHLFETCPRELRNALPEKGPKNLVADNVPSRSIMGGETPAGVGIHLSKQKETEPPEIWGVVRASPAARAGIRPGMLLFSINATNTTTLSAEKCRRMVSGRPGTSVELELADPARHATNQLTLERRYSVIAD